MWMTLALAAAATPVLSCPGASIEAQCTSADVVTKISVARRRVAALDTRCLYDFGGDCSVEASGRINVPDRGTVLHWQRLALVPRGGPIARMVVLIAQDKAGRTRLAGFAESSGSIGAPELVASGDKRSLVHLAGISAGPGEHRMDALFVADHAESVEWRRIDMADWSEQGSKMLPAGYQIARPAMFAFDDMSVDVLVGREGDADCCPRGGAARFDLEIVDDRLSLTRMHFQPMQPYGREVEVVAGVLVD